MSSILRSQLRRALKGQGLLPSRRKHQRPVFRLWRRVAVPLLRFAKGG